MMVMMMMNSSNNNNIMKRMFQLLVLTTTLWCAKGDFGDYVDPTFDCPALTTCQQVCVPSVKDCPISMLCDMTAGETLCPDGSCIPATEACPTDVGSPCENECAPVACAKVIDYFDNCQALYGSFYDSESECAELAQAETTQLYTFTEPAFIFQYVWITALTFCIWLWCAYNQRYAPVLPHSSQPLAIDSHRHHGARKGAAISSKSAGSDTEGMTTSATGAGSENFSGGLHGLDSIAYHTGYRTHWVGTVLYVLTALTLVSIQVYLAWLTIQYYVQQEAITAFTLHFQDEVQVLFVFEIVWMVGFVWSFALKWPYSLRSLFYRRCRLEEAEYVAVCSMQRNDPSSSSFRASSSFHEEDVVDNNTTTTYIRRLKKCFSSMYRVLCVVMSFVFSDKYMFGAIHRYYEDAMFKFCPVRHDEDDGSKYFVFMFRRYVLDVPPKQQEQGDGEAGDTSTASCTKDATAVAVDKGKEDEDVVVVVVDTDAVDGEVNTSPVPGRKHLAHSPSSVAAAATVAARFVPGEWIVGKTIQEIASVFDGDKVGLTQDDVKIRRSLVGRNVIEMPKPNPFKSLKKEVSKAFYTYQMFFIWTWMNFWYYYMACVYMIVMLTGLVAVTIFHYRNECNLYQITRITGNVRVVRDNETVTIPQEDIVPGDVIHVDGGMAFCDMMLVSGETVLIDEGALTGEAHPIGKVPVDRTLGLKEFDSTIAHKRNTILAGTTILESDSSSRAVVLKTASYTARGGLLRDIFTYKRHQFKFDSEVPIVLAILFFYAIFGFAMAFYWTGEVFAYGWFYGMFVVSTTIPPLLPTVFTVSVGISDDRLSRKQIACSQSESILVAGKVKKACFDKTGTLTKQGLDFISVRCKSTWDEKEAAVPSSADVSLGMAVCHGLTQSKSGVLIGNPVDRAMFEACGGSIDTIDSSLVTDRAGNKVTIVRLFDFDFHRMTQSVIVKHDDGSLVAFVKGSGESIKNMCEESTLPDDFHSALEISAKSGIYQISMATKLIDANKMDVRNITRDEVECGLSFIGCINFKNMIRDDTPSVIKQLQDGEVSCYMITGDSVLTGICVAKESGIIMAGKKLVIGAATNSKEVVWSTEDGEQVELPSFQSSAIQDYHLAISGQAWQALLASLSPADVRCAINHIRVYGRCNPRDKVSVISEFVKAGYTTCMVGDGGNDCGALKTAHVGIALSDAEASIVAPFTSLDKEIGSVVDVIREGRCSLASALASYKFMIMYGQIETINQLINAYFLITFTEWCWVFMDGIWTVTLAFSLPLANAAKKLSPSRPTASLLGLWTMSSVLGILLINFLFTVGGLSYLHAQDWYQCRKWDGGDVSNLLVIGDNYETEVIFLVTGFQYIMAAAAYNFGYEFRQAWIRNYTLACLVALFTVMHFYITLVPSNLSCVFHVNCENENAVRSVSDWNVIPIQNPFNTTVMPIDFRKGLIGLMVGNGLAVCGWDFFVVNGVRRYMGNQRRKKQEKLTAPLQGKENEEQFQEEII